MPDIPDRLLRGGRPVIEAFDPDELLYRACPPGSIEGDIVLASAIDYPSCSVNRGCFSEPADVLIPEKRRGWISAECQVREVPVSLTSGDKRVFDFKAEHVPEEENYAHSEIRVYVGGVRHEKVSPPKVRLDFRMLLAQKMRVVR